MNNIIGIAIISKYITYVASSEIKSGFVKKVEQKEESKQLLTDHQHSISPGNNYA